MTTELLAVRENSDLATRLVVSLDELRLQLRELDEFKRDIMVPDVDYGVIPGTKKPTLLKPGAEKLAMAFGLAPDFRVTDRSFYDWERGRFYIEVECRLMSKRTGLCVANGIGSANSLEPRYRWRDALPECPACGREVRRSKRREGDQGDPGWYCWTRTGGCGATYQATEISAGGRVENPEPFELVNTLAKMGQKRALVAGVLVATGGSGIWTQDLEDGLPGEGGPVVEAPSRPVPPAQAPQAQPAQANGAARPASPAPKNARQAAAAVATKPTDTKCELCERVVENASVLKSGVDNFGIPLCVGHYNAALDQAKGETEAPF